MSFVKELQRRNVIRMAVLYLVAAWLLLQITDVLSSLMPVPEWTGSLVILLLTIAFPLVLIFSWVYELTPEGLKREKEVDRDESITHQTGRKVNTLIVVLLILAIAGLALDRLIPERAPVVVTRPAEMTSDEAEATAEPTQLAANKFARPPDRSIAVLPFVNMSGDVENEYFSDGLTEELLNVLAQIKDLQVAGRTSSFAFKGKDEDLRVIGEKLSVAHLLEGSVRKSGDRVRVTAQLIKSDDGYHLWSDTYDREIDDVFAIQEDIAGQVVDALKVTLLGEDAARIGRTPTASAEAHDAYLLGRHMLFRFSYDSLKQAESKFKQATRLDPEYAEAWAGLGKVYADQSDTGVRPATEAYPLAEAALDQAIVLDPELAESHTEMGLLHLRRRQEDKAEQAFEKARQLQPNDPYVNFGLARLMARRGDFEAALEYNSRALAVDPMGPEIIFQRANYLTALGRTDDALAQFARLREVDPSSPNGFYGPAGIYRTDLGRLDEAARWYARSAEVDPSDYELPGLVAMVFLDLGDTQAALPWVEKANEMGPGQSVPHMARLMWLRRSGDRDGALAMARQYLDMGMEERQEDMWVVLRTLHDHAVETGEYDEALAAYRSAVPHFFEDPITNVFYRNYIGIDVIPLLRLTGQEEQATRIGEAILEELRRRDPRMLRPYNRISEVWILTYLGRLDEAAESLRLYVEEGERSFWWFGLEEDPSMAPLRSRPEYPELITAIRKDIAAQRERAAALNLVP
jgi:TolB-like protein/Tfp pilus assembly protein PilF